MTRYLFDTNHASLLYRQHPRLQSRFAAAARSDRIYLSLPTVGELWFMVFNSARVAQNAALMERFLSAFDHMEFDEAATREFGRIKAAARRRGRQLSGVDAQIAAIAHVNDLTLLTDDGDFAGVPGLKIENWLR